MFLVNDTGTPKPVVEFACGAKVKSATCPTCNTANDGATGMGVNDAPPVLPTDGDLGICMYCGEVTIYGDNATTLHKITEEEMRAMVITTPGEAHAILCMVKLLRDPQTNKLFGADSKQIKDATGTAWDLKFRVRVS
jgi:hypothetical protein